MSDDAGIADSLPPPRGDEPPELRRDILDELNDHLDCTVQREMLRGQDETDARRAAIQRFGDIPTIARQLWWDAMKERIMTGRISIALSIVTVCLVLVLAGFVLPALQDQRQFNQQLLTKLASMPQPVTPAASLEWGSLTIELLDEHGKPMADWPIHIEGNMYNPNTHLKREIRTDTLGKVILDPIRGGTDYTVWLDGRYHWKYVAKENDCFVEPGERKVFTIHQPYTPLSPVTFDFEIPKAWKDTNLRTIYIFAMKHPITTEPGQWWPSQWVLNTEGGSIVSVSMSYQDGSSASVLKGDLLLPAGTYILSTARLENGHSLSEETRSLIIRTPASYPEGEFTFEVKPGVVNHINLPLPPGMLATSAANMSGGLGAVSEVQTSPETTNAQAEKTALHSRPLP